MRVISIAQIASATCRLSAIIIAFLYLISLPWAISDSPIHVAGYFLTILALNVGGFLPNKWFVIKGVKYLLIFSIFIPALIAIVLRVQRALSFSPPSHTDTHVVAGLLISFFIAKTFFTDNDQRPTN